jgi:NAD+ synthase
VLGVIMPSASNPDDADAARLVAEAFGVKSLTVDLTSLADSFYGTVPTAASLFGDWLNEDEPDGTDARQQLATANVRPRLRMITLYYVANLSRGIVVGTGNKTESMIGYFTKYGDGGVDVLPIGELLKTEVRGMARELGVPQPVIDKAPSAGLWLGQTDEQEMGFSYAELERYLTGDPEAITPALALRLERMIRATEHKRSIVPTPATDEGG